MSGSFFGTMQVALICGAVLMVVFLRTINQPDSPAKELAMKVLTLAGCALYILSPIDVVPEVIFGPLGLVDDAVALWVAAKTGYRLYNPTPSKN